MSDLNWKDFIFSRILIILCAGLGLLVLGIELVRHPILFFKRTKRVTPPDCMLDPTLGKHEYVKANGIKFHYVTSGDPSKPLMLFLHGFPEFWYSWRHQMKEFSNDFHVVSLDMRGYGETDRPPNVQDYLIENICQDIVELVPALGHDKAILVSHDWGGAIAWAVTQKHPEVVEKLIVMNCPHPHVFAKWMEKHLTQLMKSWYMFMFQVPCLAELMLSIKDYGNLNECFRGKNGPRNKNAFTAEDVEAYIYVFSQPGAVTPPLNYYRANVLRMKTNTGNKGSKIGVPTLLIWGDEDMAFDVEMVDGHSKVVDDLTVKHIKNCSHWVQNDDPENVNLHMREFLE